MIETTDKYKELSQFFKYCLLKLPPSELNFDLDLAAEALCERERLGRTASGGCALPHTKVDLEDGSGLILALKLVNPIVWPTGSMDGRPVSIVCIILTPEKSAPGNYLKVMARIDRTIRELLGDKMNNINNIDENPFVNTITENLKETSTVSCIKIIK